MNRYLWLIVLTLFALCIYFALVVPFFPSLSFVVLENNARLESLKTYFTAISPFFGIFFSLIGVCFGYYYYHHKNLLEDDRNSAERQNKFVETVLLTINELGTSAYNILHVCFAEDNELSKIRSKLLQDDDYLETLLTHADETYNWSQYEYRDIARFRSFISTNGIISHFSRQQIDTNRKSLASAIEKHKFLLNAAKLSCLRKVESIYR